MRWYGDSSRRTSCGLPTCFFSAIRKGISRRFCYLKSPEFQLSLSPSRMLCTAGAQSSMSLGWTQHVSLTAAHLYPRNSSLLVGSGKTNKLGYELYGFVAEANGIALPLIFLYIRTDEGSSENCKGRMIACCLRYIKPFRPNLKFTLSDKDPQEIGAVQDVFPEVKHQLCYWHVLRYVTERMNDNTRPRAYNARQANSVFSFIDVNWIPQDQDEDAGAQSQEPAAATGTGLTLDSIAADVQRQRKRGKLAMFCPPSHRGVIVEMHRQIMCMHPSIPSGFHNNRYLSANEIHRWATSQMYAYCRRHNLIWVWVYLWNQCYCPPQWVLWARASYPEIPRIRTTMMVESLWSKIKRRYLIDFNRPRLDLALHLILTNIVPSIRLTLAQLQGTWRSGRSDILADCKKPSSRNGKSSV